MNTFSGSVFSSTTITLDDACYRDCTFDQCLIVFCASGSVELTGCNFSNCSWEFQGAAADTIALLTSLVADLGSQGSELVRRTLGLEAI